MKKNKTLILALITAFLTIVGQAPVRAHEAKCPHCELDVVQDTPTLDNEVALKYGKKRIEYRCVMCAIADADKNYKGDLTVLAPTETKGKRIEIARKGGQWTGPEGTVFIAHKVKHRYCQAGYRAFTNKAAFDTHVQKNKLQVAGAEPVTLAQLVEVASKEFESEK